MRFFIFSLMCVFLILISCTSYVGKLEDSRKKALEIKRVLVLPFNPAKENLSEEKGIFVASLFHNELTLRIKNLYVLPFGVSSEEFFKVRRESPELSYREAAIVTGKNLGAQGVFAGALVEYRERVGGELGVESPASVAFSVELIETPKGETLWQTYFAETQRPLLENIAELGKFIRRRGKWISADQLAREGVREVVDEFVKFLESGK
jgi:hypothetical protein